ELALKLAVRLGEAGEGEERRALLADLLPRFAADSRHAGIEEAALEFVEHEDLDGLPRLIEVLPTVAADGAPAACAQLLAIALPPVAAAGAAGPCDKALRAIVASAAQGGAGAAAPFREALVEALKQGPAKALPDANAVFATSGIEDRMKPLPQALE